MTGPDPLLASLMASVPEEHRHRVASLFGAADLLGRHTPVHDVPRIIAAVWLTFATLDAWERGDHDLAKVLDQLAGALVTDVGGRMALRAGLAAGAPDTPAGP